MSFDREIEKGAPRRDWVELVDAARVMFQASSGAFVVTQGEAHVMAYMNLAFRNLAGNCPIAIGMPLASACDAPALQPLLDRARRDGIGSRAEVIPARGTTASWCCNVWPLETESGHHDGTVVEIAIAENSRMELQRQVAERLLLGALREMDAAAAAREAEERAHFLAEAGRDLAASVDSGETRAKIAALRMPGPSTWCIVDVIESDGSLCRLAIVHPDPALRAAARALEDRWKPRAGDRFGAPAILNRRDPVGVVRRVMSVVERSAESKETLEALRALGIGSLLTVPMEVHGGVLGAITFVGGVPRERFTPDEIELAEALALRSAVALDNARLYGEALDLKQQAQEGSRAKSEFLARMSHELRTPLNAIAGFVDIIDMGIHGPVTVNQKSDLSRIKASQEHLLFMINDILNYMTINRGRAKYDTTDLPVRDLIVKAVEMVESLLGAKNLTLAALHCSTDVWVRADAERMHQVLLNLLTNAAKYTPPGGMLGIECETVDETVSVTVWDTGIGVAEDRLESIFEPFVQELSGYSDRAGGVGLGLAISRELARAMGGNIIARSTPGEGSRFTLTLPRAHTRRLTDARDSFN